MKLETFPGVMEISHTMPRAAAIGEFVPESDNPEVRTVASYPPWKRAMAIVWVVFLCGFFAFCGLALAVIATGAIGCG
jgi:hypothetical protein